jgi:hypothetical protein
MRAYMSCHEGAFVKAFATRSRGVQPDGTRLALIGAVLYLLEWVAIIAAAPPGPFGPGASTHKIVSEYGAHVNGAAFAAGWFAVVLGGRVLFVAGLKGSLRRWRRERPLLDFALGAMAISVVLEIVAYSIVAATARLDAAGASSSTLVALDGTSYWIDLFIFGPVGLAVLASAWAMHRSRAFPSWLTWVGFIAGVAGVAACLLAGATTHASTSGSADGVSGVAAFGLWIWMLGVGVLLWRRPSAVDGTDSLAEPARVG